MASAEDVTGILYRLRKVRDVMLAHAKEVRNTEASSSKTYEECAELVTEFIIGELDEDDTKEPEKAKDV